jgi:hypothetical protein
MMAFETTCECGAVLPVESGMAGNEVNLPSHIFLKRPKGIR